MKPAPQFGKLKAKPQALKPDYDHQERAAIHEFDGQLPRLEAEARAAAECQHCGRARPLQPVWRADYGHGLDVCAGCAKDLEAAGWQRGSGPAKESPI